MYMTIHNAHLGFKAQYSPKGERKEKKIRRVSCVLSLYAKSVEIFDHRVGESVKYAHTVNVIASKTRRI